MFVKTPLKVAAAIVRMELQSMSIQLTTNGLDVLPLTELWKPWESVPSKLAPSPCKSAIMNAWYKLKGWRGVLLARLTWSTRSCAHGVYNLNDSTLTLRHSREKTFPAPAAALISSTY